MFRTCRPFASHAQCATVDFCRVAFDTKLTAQLADGQLVLKRKKHSFNFLFHLFEHAVHTELSERHTQTRAHTNMEPFG